MDIKKKYRYNKPIVELPKFRKLKGKAKTKWLKTLHDRLNSRQENK